MHVVNSINSNNMSWDRGCLSDIIFVLSDLTKSFGMLVREFKMSLIRLNLARSGFSAVWLVLSVSSLSSSAIVLMCWSMIIRKRLTLEVRQHNGRTTFAPRGAGP